MALSPVCPIRLVLEMWLVELGGLRLQVLAVNCRRWLLSLDLSWICPAGLDLWGLVREQWCQQLVLLGIGASGVGVLVKETVGAIRVRSMGASCVRPVGCWNCWSLNSGWIGADCVTRSFVRLGAVDYIGVKGLKIMVLSVLAPVAPSLVPLSKLSAF